MVQLNMKMPSNCMTCRLLGHTRTEEAICYLTGDDIPEYNLYHNHGRPDFCPLNSWCNSVRAFEDPQYDYYRLTRDFGMLKAGTIFYHDFRDGIYGSVAKGCLKNCWAADGNCENGLCGGTVILHYDFVKTDWFEKVSFNTEEALKSLSEGEYLVDVRADGSFDIRRRGENE